MSDEINNRADILDSRDIIARIEELQAELEDAHEGEGNGGDFTEWLQEASDDSAHTLQDAATELLALLPLAEQGEDYSDDWQYGATLIRDSYFTEYAEQLADDIGAIDSNASWPLTYIDWDAAADALKQDYTSVEFDGVTYWVR